MPDDRLAHVPDGLAGERVDATLARMFGLSRSKAADLAEAGHVQLDGRVVAKSARVEPGQLLEVHLPDVADPGERPEPDLEALHVLHDDADLVVVDKPVGVAAHPSLGFDGPSVTGILKARGYRIATSGAPERRGIVQRLDVGTSGVMVLAKSEPAYSHLKQQFRDRRPEKVYHALVQGLPDPIRGTIDAPIARHPHHDWKFAVRAEGRASVTHYEVLEAFRFASLLEVHLETGRTHQIRVHMAAIRHPCVGDLTYGADPTLAARCGLQRQWLHAVRLGFEHPGTGEWVEFTSPYPADLDHALRVLAPD
ncbi:MAG: RluA family pseudouridine synthase [Candidatus Nanopelagicales bacterium]|nr:RluA family pseudouridine synthase [Candidatus Nanopelagicales bacterium]